MACEPNTNAQDSRLVMPALVAASTSSKPCNTKDVDGRDNKPGHDGESVSFNKKVSINSSGL